MLGKTKVSTRVGEFGPEIGFAFGIASSNQPVYLIKYHASGMPLHHGWNGDKWLGGSPAPGRRNFYPGESSTDPNIGSLYANMLKQFQEGVAYLQKKGVTPNIKGVLWMQGEQDSKQEESATSYASSLRRLRKRIAEDMKTKLDLPLVFGQVLPHDPPLERFNSETRFESRWPHATPFRENLNRWSTPPWSRRTDFLCCKILSTTMRKGSGNLGKPSQRG